MFVCCQVAHHFVHFARNRRMKTCSRIPVLVGLCAVVLLASQAASQPPSDRRSDVADGLSINKADAFHGYTLVFPMNSTSTYLVDMEGRIVQEWKSEFTPALSAYLLPNGHLLRPAAEQGPMAGGPGAGGRIQEFTWDGELVWDYSLATDTLLPHHDICPLPNGNVLVICNDKKTAEQAIAAGRRPESVTEQLLPDCILEIKRTGLNTGEVVWAWYAWDHLVQDVDKSKPNYGDVSEHPERIDVNFGSDRFARMLADPEQLARLRSLGYVGGGGPAPEPRSANGNAPPGDDSNNARTPARQDANDRETDDREREDRRRDGPGRRGPGGPMQGDWMHTNSVAYSAELDQIMLSIHGFNEVWIIDHSTTMAEAASGQGGKSGKGGDLLYRWGNPQAYRSGSNVDQRLFGQHCAHWIPTGYPGAGNMLVFNNGGGRPDGSYSSVDEVRLPVQSDGTYAKDEYLAYGPDKAVWSYVAPDKETFFSALISGAQRLPNGNTFICSGNPGILFEVTPSNDVVWRYKHPGAGFGGPGGFPFALPRPGEVLPGPLVEMLQLSSEQREQLAELQKDVDAKLASLLTDDQRSQLDEMQRGGMPGFGRRGPGGPGAGGRGFGPPGQGPAGNDRGGPPSDRRPSDRGPSDRGRNDRGDQDRRGPGRGPGGLFRSYRYAADYPGLAGRELTPGKPLAEQ
jgi:hypothetical protein